MTRRSNSKSKLQRVTAQTWHGPTFVARSAREFYTTPQGCCLSFGLVGEATFFQNTMVVVRSQAAMRPKIRWSKSPARLCFSEPKKDGDSEKNSRAGDFPLLLKSSQSPSVNLGASPDLGPQLHAVQFAAPRGPEGVHVGGRARHQEPNRCTRLQSAPQPGGTNR